MSNFSERKLRITKNPFKERNPEDGAYLTMGLKPPVIGEHLTQRYWCITESSIRNLNRSFEDILPTYITESLHNENSPKYVHVYLVKTEQEDKELLVTECEEIPSLRKKLPRIDPLERFLGERFSIQERF